MPGLTAAPAADGTSALMYDDRMQKAFIDGEIAVVAVFTDRPEDGQPESDRKA